TCQVTVSLISYRHSIVQPGSFSLEGSILRCLSFRLSTLLRTMKTTPLIDLADAVFLLLSAWPLLAREIPIVPPAKAGLSESKLCEVDQFMERSVADQKIAGGLVLVSHDGKVGFFHCYGQMDREAKTTGYDLPALF